MMRSWREFRITELLILPVALAAARPCESLAADTPSTPDEIVRVLVERGPVSSFVTEDAERLYRIVRENPARFTGPIAAWLGLPENAATRLPAERLEELLSALSLFQLVGRAHGEAALFEFYIKATRLSDEAAAAESRAAEVKEEKEAIVLKNRILGDYVVLRRRVLDVLGEIGSPALIDQALQTLEREDYSVQVVMLRYLTKTGAGSAEVARRLTAISENAASPLRNDPALRNAIAALAPQES